VQIEELLTARDEALSEQAEGGFYHDVWQLRKRFAGISSFRRRVRGDGWSDLEGAPSAVWPDASL